MDYAQAIRAVADVGDQLPELSEFDVTVPTAIAYHQPIMRDGFTDIFVKEICCNLLVDAGFVDELPHGGIH